ncbi:MAG: hypothetical protein A2W93_11085 [Bacteroidetes bacterium GWF2_43_63]|nr:MAG: hypothetical protein A2W93_11085 [Bacteroidetes bacterium GWF2_43_63]
MKKILLISVLMVLGCIPAMSQGFNNAGEYMQFINNEHTRIKKDLWNYMAALAHGKGARKVESKRQELISTTEAAEKKVKNMRDWDDNTEYRDSVSSYLDICTTVLKEDFAKIVDMEEIAEKSYDAMEAYLMVKEAANNKLDEAAEMVAAAQQKFATEFGITLIDEQSKLDQKLEKSGPVFDYYNVVYLIFFKAYIQEFNMMQAINTGDINAAEQNKSAMIQFSKEGLTVLDSTKSFKSDLTLISASKKYLTFCQKEGEEKIPVILDFYLKKDNFEKQNVSFESIPKNKRTQTDVDNYNKAVSDYNASIAEYNKVNEELNVNRAKNLEVWNSAAESFLDRHIPQKR